MEALVAMEMLAVAVVLELREQQQLTAKEVTVVMV